MLLAGAVAAPCGDGFVVADDAQRVMAVIGDAREVIARPGFAVLCAIEREDLADALRAQGWRVERAVLHTLPDPDDLPDDEGAVAIGPGADLALDHLDPAVREELTRAHAAGVIHAAFVDGVAVSFAYAPWRTERWFDVSVDTAPGARQLGLATRVAAAMIRAERAAGREPVWGAAESNHASRALARRLGFLEVDALWVGIPR